MNGPGAWPPGPRWTPAAVDVADTGRVALGDTGWWIWEHFALRGTGFPLADLTAALAADEPEAAIALASTDAVTMALLWQNRDAVDHVLLPLRRGDAPEGSKRHRARLRTLVSY